jgi:hypothetical protein
MKQHITPKQLEELSEQGKEKLRAWWKPQEGDWFMCLCHGEKHLLHDDNDEGCEVGNDYFHRFNDIEKPLPLLSIGQMIQYLDEHRDKDDFVPLAIDKGEYEWHVYSVSKKPSYRSVELCDCLWEAVKKELEEE